MSLAPAPPRFARSERVAPARLDVVDEPLAETGLDSRRRPVSQRSEAIRSSGLPPFRVLEIPAIAGDLDPPDTDALRAVLVKIAGIGVVESRRDRRSVYGSPR